jgi:hypothetical protein
VYVLPAESRPFGIGEDVEGFDAHSDRVIARGNGPHCQVLDLVEPTERFAGSHDHPLGLGSDQFVKIFDVICRECDGEGLDEIGLRNHLVLLSYILDLCSIILRRLADFDGTSSDEERHAPSVSNSDRKEDRYSRAYCQCRKRPSG